MSVRLFLCYVVLVWCVDRGGDVGYSVSLLRPRNLFKSREQLAEFSGVDASLLPNLTLFDVPLLAVIVNERGLPHVNSNRYLAEFALASRSVTGDAVRTYAESLVAWLNYWLTIRRAETEATEFDLKSFRHFLFACTAPQMSPASISLRLGCVARYYEWAAQSGIMSSPLGSWLCSLRSADLAPSSLALRRTIGRRVGAVLTQKIPAILGSEELTALFGRARDPYSLIFRWAVCTGLRRFEICQLTLDHIEQASNSANGISRIRLMRKGGYARDV